MSSSSASFVSPFPSSSAVPDSQRVQALLLEGLRHFSMNAIDDANACWRQVLEIHPEHPTATHYLRNDLVLRLATDPVADMRAAAEGSIGPFKRPEAAYERAADLLAQGRLEEGRAVLRYGQVYFGDAPMHFGEMIDLVGDLLTLRYVRHLGPLGQTVHHRARRPQGPVAANLSAEQMHVLALVDVNTDYGEPFTIDALLTNSLYGVFGTLRAVVQLRADGLVVLDAPTSETPTDDAPAHEGAREATGPEATGPDKEVTDFGATWDPPSLYVAPSGDGTAARPAASPEADDRPDASEPSADDDAFRARYREAARAYVQGKTDEARRLFEQCIAMRPDDPRPRRSLERLDALSSDTA
jgi:tetratricopeptide (TPR) repeat protein